MRIAIIGSRFIENKKEVFQIVSQTVSAAEAVGAGVSLLSGGSEGVDSFVHEWAREHKIDSYMFKPHFLLDSKAQYSARDFFTRYRQIVDNADTVIIVLMEGKPEPDLAFAKEYATSRNKNPLVVTCTQEVLL